MMKHLKKLMMQVDQPFFAVKKKESIQFITEDDQFFLNDFNRHSLSKIRAFVPSVTPADLGSRSFKKRHSIKYPYIAGAMAKGITSAAIVKTMAENGMLAFFGSAGLSIEKIEESIIDLKKSLPDKSFGFNLIHSPADSAHEMATTELYLKHNIKLVSAAAFMRMTPALVLYRIKGIYKKENGKIVTPNNIIAKVSRVEIANQFFSPPPLKIVNILLEKELITKREAELSLKIPMAYDLTAEADSGGHTDNRPALVLMPTMIALKNKLMERFKYDKPLCVGLAGGIATPQSAAVAFSMGAAFILTGSINQSCVEAGTCEDVKKKLCGAQQADTAMAPAADMFEIGTRVQVLKRGTLFPVRAEKLYKYYKSFDCFDDIDEKSKKEIEEKILQSSFKDSWNSTKAFFKKQGNMKEIENARNNPKHKMALVFKSYLGLSSQWAVNGDVNRKMDYQIWCGPAIGAFNQWVKDSFLEHYENRKTAEIALNLLLGACISLRVSMLRTQGVEMPVDIEHFKPMTKEKILSLLKIVSK